MTLNKLLQGTAIVVAAVTSAHASPSATMTAMMESPSFISHRMDGTMPLRTDNLAFLMNREHIETCTSSTSVLTTLATTAWTLSLMLLPPTLASSTLQPSKAPSTTFEHLEERVRKLFSSIDFHPHKRTQSHVEWTDDGTIAAVSRGITHDFVPSDFEGFLNNFVEEFPLIHPLCCFAESLGCDESHVDDNDNAGREGIKAYLRLPFPLRERVLYPWLLKRLHVRPNEHLLVMTEDDNDELIRQHYHETPEANSKRVQARMFLCAYWIRPLHNDRQEIVGTEILYCFSGDAGGGIPQCIQNTLGPKGAQDSVQGLLKHLRKQRRAACKVVA